MAQRLPLFVVSEGRMHEDYISSNDFLTINANEYICQVTGREKVDGSTNEILKHSKGQPSIHYI